MRVVRIILFVAGALCPWAIAYWCFGGIVWDDAFIVGVVAFVAMMWKLEGRYDKSPSSTRPKPVLSLYSGTWGILLSLYAGYYASKGINNHGLMIIEFVALMWMVAFFWRLLEWLDYYIRNK